MAGRRILCLADLHLRAETEEVCFEVLRQLRAAALSFEVDAIGFVGDTFHSKYEMSSTVLTRFDEWLRASPCTVILLPGNHDQWSFDGRTILEVFARPPSVRVYLAPTWDEFGFWVPFRKDAAAVAEVLKTSTRPDGAMAGLPAPKSRVAFAHHGIVGAMMNDHKVAGGLDGVAPAAFAGFDLAILGHWHLPQTIEGKIHYVGSPWQVTAAEAGQAKRFVVVDPNAGQILSSVNVVAGARYHRVEAGAALPELRPGDIVTVEGADEAKAASTAEAVRAAGAEARTTIATPDVPGRSALPSGLGLRAAAEAYAAANDAPPTAMAVFAELWGSL